MKNIENIDLKIPGIFPSLLTVLFIGLKLTNNIAWSWFWVLSPLWIEIVLMLIIILIIVICLTFFDSMK